MNFATQNYGIFKKPLIWLLFLSDNNVIETIFQRIVVNKETEEFNHFVNTAEELYLDIMKNKPDWLLEIPQYHIASYLGITPETLSRIRKRI
ncbi:MAG: hypothetical protein O9282_10690 [Flavobacterium sp.]|uniref:hypothetical protein n=1 Tax=Flavobacterium sp. TaxID=239 RepID=UPI0022CCFE23|nr:hypothetical protein [Flavobacterium sp.]MCZ8331767.1 hypothetical protein [Flavobacterium sp.]